jgi:FAD synthase
MSGLPVVDALQKIPALGGAVVAMGTFDGVHRGHRYLLTQACQRAHSHGDSFVVITFTPNPQLVLRPALRHFELSPAPIKVALLAETAPDCVALLPFTSQLMATSADAFMAALEERVVLREMWMGEDFAFGHRRSGNVPYLIARGQSDGFSVHVIPRISWRDEPVSSTRIRQALADGDIALANDLLGHPLHLLGRLDDEPAYREDQPGQEGSLLVALAQALPAAGTYRAEVLIPPVAGTPGQAALLHIPAQLPAEGGTCRLGISFGPRAKALHDEASVLVLEHAGGLAALEAGAPGDEEA